MLDKDVSGYRDLFRFDKGILLKSFKPTDLYGEYVLERIKN